MLHRGRHFSNSKVNCKPWKIFGKPRKRVPKLKKKFSNNGKYLENDKEIPQTQKENCNLWKTFDKPRKGLTEPKNKFQNFVFLKCVFS